MSSPDTPLKAPPADFDGALNSVDPLIRELETEHGGRLVARCTLPASQGDHCPLPADLDPRLLRALEGQGVERLYSHQRAAYDAVSAGRHTVVVTPTASGKTLCYNLPVLQALLSRRARALYLFPSKALAQDQRAALEELNTAGALGIRAYTFDGDTPGDARRMVRSHGQIVVSNPDMLHQGILPQHTKWAQFFEELQFLVIDEMHAYRGVFGSHVANVLRRLWRVCAFYRVRPTVILCSATIANPAQLAEKLIGEPVTAITDNGAPRGRRELLLWNPPVVNAELGIRVSSRAETTGLAQRAIRQGLKTIVFARTRQAVEVLTRYLKESFDADPRHPARVRSYRGGYLPGQRRDTERQLRQGEVDCVVATSALELGVDIGALDVCILNGYPGTIAGTWQRLGRAGRRLRPALGVLVGSSLPLDQYLMQHPEFFLDASPEHARIDPNQLLILLDHIRCAAFELPFRDGERFGDQDTDEFLTYLTEENLLHHEQGQWHWMAEGYPANAVNLRTGSDGNVVVLDTTDGARRVIGEVDLRSAPTMLHEGAVYLTQAETYQVAELDWANRVARVRRAPLDHFTEAIDYQRLRVLEAFEEDGNCAHGEVHLLRRVAGYKKIRFHSHENVGYGKVNLPDQELHTTAVWWRLEAETLDAAFDNRWQALDGFLGAAHALHLVAALLSMCEPLDLGRAVGSEEVWFATVGVHGRGDPRSLAGEPEDLDERPFHPTVFLYDNFPGGIGLAAPLYELRGQVLNRAHGLISGCACEHGCPACVGPILPGDEGDGLSPRAAALRILALLGAGAHGR